MTRSAIKTALAVAIAVFIIGCTQGNQQAKQENREISPAAIVVPDKKGIVEEEIDRTPVEKDASRRVMRKEVARQIQTVPAVAAELAASGGISNDAYDAVTLKTIRLPSEPVDRENYAHFDDNPVKRVAEYPVSTFSIDVDTGSYANIRRMLNAGQLPRKDAIRSEELINYFSYDYPLPSDLSRPFSVYKEIAPTPWNKDTYLLHIGIKGYHVAEEKLPSANLVFLVDVCGSMNSPDKLGLLKSSLKLLTKRLTAKDRVSLVVYAGASGVVLEPTPGDQKGKISIHLEKQKHPKYLLEIRDSGSGFENTFDAQNANTLGVQLIEGLTEQLNGKIELLDNGAGCSC